MTEVQPWSGASMSDQTSTVTPATDSSAPATSNRPSCACRDSGSSHQPAASATSATGTLTRKTEPQLKCCSRIPPETGPSATASPDTPDQMPIAVARSRASVKTLVSRARVAG